MFKVVDFVNVFFFIPETIGFVNENEVFILVVGHLGNVVNVGFVDQKGADTKMSSVHRLDSDSLSSMLHIHVISVIAVEVLRHVDITSILELLGNLEEAESLAQPRERRSALILVELVAVEGRREHEDDTGDYFMEPDPFEHLSVLVDCLAHVEVQSGVGVHGGSLHEGLELVARMCRGSFDTKDFFDGLLAEYGVAESVSNVRELLVFSPLDIVDGSPVSGVVSNWLVGLSLFPVLQVGRSIRVRGFSPSVEVLEVLVIQIIWAQSVVLRLQVFVLETGRYVAFFIQIVGSDLGDVEIDHVLIVGINLN